MSGILIKKRHVLTLLCFLLIAGIVACGPAAENPDTVHDNADAEVVAKEPVDNNADETAETDNDDTIVDVVEEEAVEEELVDETNEIDAAGTDDTESETSEADDVASTSLISVTEPTETYNGLTVGFTDDGHPFIGDPNAPVLIEEYSDFQCPFCQRFYSQSMSTLKTTEFQNGDAVLVFYDFPLSFHAQAAAAANAARCAGEFGAAAYWHMHDRLFDTLGQWSVVDPVSLFAEYAAEFDGVDVEQFTACATEDRFSAEIKADESRGRSKGITGTPGFLVNGQLISGAQPYQVFAQAINLAKDSDSIVPEPETANNVVDTPQISVTEPTETYNGLTVGFTDDGHPFVGDPDAPVIIEEYSDFQCPFCQRFYSQSMSTLKTTEIQNGDAVLVFYDFPLSFHAQAAAAANAARCAGEFGAAAYWHMHDRLFETLGQWSVADPIPLFAEYAAEFDGVDIEQFTTCATEDRFSAEIKADELRGRSNGITGTPGFLVNGQLISGAQPYQVFAQAVSLAKSGQSIIPEVAEIEVPEPQAITFTSKTAFAIGDPDAKVKIIEFSDLQCPYCAKYTAETFPTLLTEYINTGRVYYEFRDLPLNQIHPLAQVAAVAARCAGEQDAYLELHDLLFARQGAWGQSADPSGIFGEYVTELGLDATAFSTCLTSGKFDQDIEANFQEAIKYQINSTPYFVVNGFPVLRAAQPIESFENVIQMVEEDRLVDEIKASIRRQMEAEQQQAAQQAAQPTPTPVPNVGVIPEGDAFVIGSADAPITIVEYTDYQCPYCQRHFTQTFPQIKANYIDKGLVRYVFKDFPLNFHSEAEEAAVAARCAKEQSLFLEMHTALFEQTSDWSGQPDVYTVLADIAAGLGADTDAFTECVGRGEYEAAVRADLNEGSGYGVGGTPAFFVNGEFVNGAQPYTVFTGLIDSLLPSE